MNNIQAGSIIDEKYELVALLGSGGAGSVYKAIDRVLDRAVAIKILRTSSTAGTDARQRFIREAKILANLQHKNVVQVFGFGALPTGQPYIVMEYVDGQTLSAVVAEEKCLSWRKVVAIGTQICDALATVHDQGIIHRDLKPQNIMLLRASGVDQIKVLDFGLSGFVHTDAQKLTHTGALIGTPQYMSPEVASGKAADLRSDVYSLGCILYECLSGRLPLSCDNPVGLLYKHRTEMPPPLRSSDRESSDELPEWLERVIFQAIQKEPALRFQTMAEFSASLNLAEGQGFVERTLNSPINRIRLRQRRHLLAAGLGAMILLSAGFVAVQFFEAGNVLHTNPAQTQGPANAMHSIADKELALQGRQLVEQLQNGNRSLDKQSAHALLRPGLSWLASAVQLDGTIRVPLDLLEKIVSALSDLIVTFDICDRSLSASAKNVFLSLFQAHQYQLAREVAQMRIRLVSRESSSGELVGAFQDEEFALIKLKRFAEAESCTERGYRIFEQRRASGYSDNQLEALSGFRALGCALMDEHLYDDAMRVTNREIDLEKSMGKWVSRYMAKAILNRASIYRRRGEVEQAQANLRMCEELMKQSDNNKPTGHSLDLERHELESEWGVLKTQIEQKRVQ